MEFKCQITDISDIQTVGSNDTKKLSFLTEEVAPGKQYPDSAAFEVYGNDKVDTFLSRYKKGDNVIVSFNLKGREHNGRHYTNLQAWKIDPIGQPDGSSADF